MICVLERLVVLAIGITKKALHTTKGAKYKRSYDIYSKFPIYLIPRPCIMRPHSNQPIKIKKGCVCAQNLYAQKKVVGEFTVLFCFLLGTSDEEA
jgi:hypothetical protein